MLNIEWKCDNGIWIREKFGRFFKKLMKSGNIWMYPMICGIEMKGNSLKPFLCQRITVSGLTTIRASLHSSHILKAPRIFGPESEFWVASVYGDKWRAVVEGQDSQEPYLIVSWTT